MTLGELTVALPPGSGCATDPRPICQALRDSYANSKFSGLDAAPGGDSWLSQLGRAILNFLGMLFRTIGTVPSIALLLLVLAGAVFFVARRIALRGRTATADETMLGESSRDVDPDREWRSALRSAAAGDYRDAIGHAFRSALLDVARRGRLVVDASWTTRDLLRAATGDGALVTAMAPAAASFEVAWYSRHEVSAADWEIARKRCLAVRTVVKLVTAVPS